jgi:hypothetical protein
VGFPTVTGIDWEISDRLALRPDVSFSISSLTSGDGAVSQQSRVLTVGLGIAIYVKRWDALRLYGIPRVAHVLNRSSSTTTTTSTASGSLGVQYPLVPRLSIFAEAGATYTHLRTPSLSTNALANRSAIGAILFF